MKKPTTLEEVQTFNDQLVALRAAGVPIGLGLGLAADLSPILQWTDAALARRIARGETLETALADPDLHAPPIYRAKLLAGVRSGDLTGLLADSNDHANQVEARSRARWSGAGYALLVLLLVFLGLVLVSLYLTPVAEDLYRDLRVQPATNMERMVWVRQSLPYWAWTPVVVVLIALAWRYGARGHKYNKQAFSLGGGGSRAQTAVFASTVADLLDHQTPLAEARTLASEATSFQATETNNYPLLHWALGPDVADPDRSAALHAVAQVYRRESERRTQGAREAASRVGWTVLAGAAVLAYGAMLLGPFVELMTKLGNPFLQP